MVIDLLKDTNCLRSSKSNGPPPPFYKGINACEPISSFVGIRIYIGVHCEYIIKEIR